MSSLTISLSGMDRISANLDRLATNIRGKVLRRALTDAAAPIETLAKALCPVSDQTGESVPGVLRDSIATKFTARIGGATSIGGFGMVIIGPRRNIKVPIRLVTRGKNKGKVKFAVPTKYAHLVEFGHVLKDSTGKIIGNVGPKPFMRGAWDGAGGDTALTTFMTSFKAGVDTEVAKL